MGEILHVRAQRSESRRALKLALLLGLSTAVVYLADGFSSEGIASLSSVLLGSSCNIKGDVDPTTGDHIYHLPGQGHYSATVIQVERGERWFCSEAEARKAGWRKAKA